MCQIKTHSVYERSDLTLILICIYLSFDDSDVKELFFRRDEESLPFEKLKKLHFFIKNREDSSNNYLFASSAPFTHHS